MCCLPTFGHGLRRAWPQDLDAYEFSTLETADALAITFNVLIASALGCVHARGAASVTRRPMFLFLFVCSSNVRVLGITGSGRGG